MRMAQWGRMYRLSLLMVCFGIAWGLFTLLSLPQDAAATPTFSPHPGVWSGPITNDFSGSSLYFTVNSSSTHITELYATFLVDCGIATVDYSLQITPGMPAVPIINNTFTQTLPGGLFTNTFVLPFRATGNFNLEYQQAGHTCLGGGYWLAFPVNSQSSDVYLPYLQR